MEGFEWLNDSHVDLFDEKTDVTWYCFVPSAFLPATHRVCLAGEIAELGEWQRRVPMIPSESRRVWQCTVTVPGSLDSTKTFDFKYAVEDEAGNVAVWEDWHNRNETTIRSKYHHRFYCTDSRQTYSGGEPFTYFFKHHIDELLRGDLTPMALLETFELLDKHGIFNTSRTLAEEAMEDIISCEANWSAEQCVLIAETLCAIIGLYKSKWATSVTTTWTNDDLQKWHPWVVHHFPNTPRNYNAKLAFVISGLENACSMVYSKLHTFSWLRHLPVLRANHQPTKILCASHFDPLGRASMNGSFLEACNLGANAVDRAFAENPPTPDATGVIEPTTTAQKETMDWLTVLLEFAPSIRTFVHLFRLHPHLTHHLNSLKLVILNRIEEMDFGGDDRSHFKILWNEVGQFRHIDTATALLLNIHHPDDYLTEEVSLAYVEVLTEGHQCTSDFVDAAKRWLRRVHAKEPSKKHETVLWSSAYTMQSYFATNAPAEPTVEETLELLEAAVVGWEQMLEIPVLHTVEATRSICFELTQAYFLKKRAHLTVVEAIIQFDARHPQSAFSEVGQHIQTLCARLVQDSNTKDVAEFKALCLPRGTMPGELHFRLLQCLAHNLGVDAGVEPEIDRLLVHAPFWGDVVSYFDPVFPDHPLGDILRSVKNSMLQLLDKVYTGAVALGDLHKVLSHQRSFQLFVSLLGDSSRERDMTSKLRERRAELELFDNKMAMVQCYVSLYCRSALLLTEEIDAEVERYRDSYASLALMDVNDAFADVQAKESLEFLYAVRGSELFLQMWKAAAMKPRGMKTAPELLQDAGWGHKDPTLTCTMCGDEFGSRNKLFKHIRDLGEHGRGGMNAPQQPRFQPGQLPQDVVVREVITEVVDNWKNLYSSLASCTAKVDDIAAILGEPMDSQEVKRELELLRSSCVALLSDTESPWDSSAVIWRVEQVRELQRLKQFLPALLLIHRTLNELFVQEEGTSDPFVQELEQAVQAVSTSGLELKDLHSVISPLLPFSKGVSQNQQKYLSTLTSCPALLMWLMKNHSTDKFNKLLSLVRPCTDDPRVLQALAALVQLRTSLSQLLYVKPPFATLRAFIHDYVETLGDLPSTELTNLEIVQSSFEGLLNLVERHTQSPGVKACYDLQDIVKHGVFILKVGVDENSLLTASKKDNEVVSYEQLADLRRQLLMTEVPEELEGARDLKSLVDNFVANMDLLTKIKELLQQLNASGHFEYFGGTKYEFPPKGLDITVLQKTMVELEEHLTAWNQAVDRVRSEHYFLNYFTVGEMQFLCSRVHRMLTLQSLPEGELPASAAVASANAGSSVNGESNVNATQKNGPADATPPPPLEFLVSDASAPLSEPAPLHHHASSGAAALGDPAPLHAQVSCATYHTAGDAEVMDDAVSVCDDVTGDPRVSKLLSTASVVAAIRPMLLCVGDVTSESFLAALTATAHLWGLDASPSLTSLPALGALLEHLFSHQRPTTRSLDVAAISATGAGLQQGDLFLNKDAGDGVFVCQVEGELVDFVLSVYARRQRLPEAEEVLLCSSLTTIEEIELLLRRYIRAKLYGRGQRVYMVAGVEHLSYSVQCHVVENLRTLLMRFTSVHAATLVFVTTKEQQMLLNALDSHRLHVSSLPKKTLRAMMASISRQKKTDHAAHMGDAEDNFCSLAVLSDINGGGKSHFILKRAHAIQEHCGADTYHRISVRENVTATALVQALNAAAAAHRDATTPIVYHMDLAHTMPEHVQSLLFALMVIGQLRDACGGFHSVGECFHKRPDLDYFFVEIPNIAATDGGQCMPIEVASFASLLPTVRVEVSERSLDMCTPTLSTRPGGTSTVHYRENDRLLLTCRFLRALLIGVFNVNSEGFNPEWEPLLDEPISEAECFKLLKRHCTPDTAPSFLLFTNFVKFMGAQFIRVQHYPMLDLNLLVMMGEGLEHFKQVFCELLVHTSADFALRQVPERRVSHMPAQDGANDIELPDLFDADHELLEELELPAPQPLLARESSAKQPEAVRYVRRFETMLSWEHSAHPICVFYAQEQTADMGDRHEENNTDTEHDRRAVNTDNHEDTQYMPSFLEVSGVEIVCLQKELVNRFISRDLKSILQANGMRLEKDWTKVRHADAMSLIRHVEGVAPDFMPTRSSHYVLTVDSLLKILSIQLRLKYDLPVLLMGETGCGKTALINFIADALNFPLHTLDIHGGIDDNDIISFIKKCALEAKRMQADHRCVVAFLDEINAANCMALCKQLICDRFIGSEKLPSNLRIVAACNPYRLRKNVEDEEVALVYQFTTGKKRGGGGHDPLSRLVYRVHPLPESLIDLVHDFGSLSDSTEELYVEAMLRRELPEFGKDDADEKKETEKTTTDLSTTLGGGIATGYFAWSSTAFGGYQWKEVVPSDYECFITAFKKLLCASHCFLREINDQERSVVSLRDITRACRVFKWFLRYYSQLKGDYLPPPGSDPGVEFLEINAQMRPHLRTAVVLSLAYTYHARLGHEHRRLFRERMCATWRTLVGSNKNLRWLNLASAEELEAMIINTQKEFVSEMNLGEGVALNEALRENLFMLLVSVMNQIPVFLVGKPGCSKSLAMELLQSNLNGEASERPFLKLFPAVEVFPFQCSPLSTAAGISSAFASARRYREGQMNKTLVVVLLDEVGLADLSPHLPLKVLHKELDNLLGVACVGISNWTLDAAKMNRAVHLYRPPPTVEDLCNTAEGMVNSSNLKAYLISLSKAFFAVYRSQVRPDFWGLREFYSTVRVINSALRRQARRAVETNDCSYVPTLEPETLMSAVLRNFGGRPEKERDAVISEYFTLCGMTASRVTMVNTMTLIAENLREPDARHLMLLTHHNAALRLLYDEQILSHAHSEVIFGSTFPADLTDVYVATNLMRIKTVMTKPICLVLVNCDALYESLYDLLNQHYMEYAGQRYVRLAHGTHSKQCPIHKLFRVIVIVSTDQAYTQLAPPLLNRFEKQLFYRHHLLTESHRELLKELQRFVHAVWQDIGGTAGFTGFVGYHSELLASLVLSEPSGPHWFDRCVHSLAWLLSPESACLLQATPIHQRKCTYEHFGVDVRAIFDSQVHTDLPSLIIEELLPRDERSASSSAHQHHGVVHAAAKTDAGKPEDAPPGSPSKSARPSAAVDAPADATSAPTPSRPNICMDALGSQVLVMTHTPISGALAPFVTRALGDKNVTLSSIMLHELSTAADLETRLHAFYNESTTSATHTKAQVLLLQADLGIAPIAQIEHCRFLCDKLRQQKIRDVHPEGDDETSVAPGVAVVPHVVIFCVHLLRERVHHEFSFDFDARWKLVFLDTVEPATLSGLPVLRDMINVSIAQVFRKASCNFGKMLRLVFRQSLARLVYPVQRTLQDATRQIGSLLHLLQHDPDFVHLLMDTMLTICDRCACTTDKSWHLQLARTPHMLALAGTFRTALHKRLLHAVSMLLSVLLAQLDRNSNLQLLEHDAKKPLWITMARYVLHQPLVLNLGTAVVETTSSASGEASAVRFDIEIDGRKGLGGFSAKWPFSFVFSSAIEGLRDASQGVLAALEQLWAMNDLKIDPELGPQDVLEYVEDFLAMNVPGGLPDGLDVKKVWELMKLSLETTKDSYLAVHVAYWKTEMRLRTYFSLFETAGGRSAAVLDIVTSLDGKYDIEVANYCCRCLLTELQSDGYSSSWLLRSRNALRLAQDVCRQPLTRFQLAVEAVSLTKNASVEKYLPAELTDYEPTCIPSKIPQRLVILEEWILLLLSSCAELRAEVYTKIVAGIAEAEFSSNACLSLMRALLRHSARSYAELEKVIADNSVRVLAVICFEENVELSAPNQDTCPHVYSAYQLAQTRLRLRHYADTMEAAPLDALLARPARMLVLKRWERTLGASGLRQMLQSLEEPWFRAWRDGEDDVALKQFLDGPILSWDALNDNKEYIAASVVLKELATATVVTEDLRARFHHIKDRMYFVSALFNEVHLLRVKAIQAPWVESLRTLLDKNAIYAFAAGFGERALEKDAPVERILILRCLMHLLSISLNGPGLLGFFRQLLRNPEALVDKWLPGMEQDFRTLMSRALGGGWYVCPKGHAYYVDACGRPTEVVTCPECGEQIGGMDHELLDTNKRLPDDMSPPMYCLTKIHPDTENILHLRHLPNLVARSLRWCVHGIMLAGVSAGVDYSCIRNSSVEVWADNDLDDQKAFLEAHFERDWSLLKNALGNAENVAMYLHHGFLFLQKIAPKFMTDLSSIQERAKWEEIFCTKAFRATYADGDDAARRRFDEEDHGDYDEEDEEDDGDDDREDEEDHGREGEDDAARRGVDEEDRRNDAGEVDEDDVREGENAVREGEDDENDEEHEVAPRRGKGHDKGYGKGNGGKGGHNGERERDSGASGAEGHLTERDIAAIQAQFKTEQSSGPFLAELQEEIVVADLDFAYRDVCTESSSSTASPFTELKNHPELDTYPLLSLILRNYPGPLEALPYLRDCIQWVSYVNRTFSRRIDRATARKMTLADALLTASAAEKVYFAGFQKAWRAAWRYVERYGCLVVPREYRAIDSLDESRPLTFCAASEQDEGICCLALLQFLTETHNSIFDALQVFDRPVASRLAGVQDVIDLDKLDIKAFVRNRCLHYVRGTRAYDVQRAERFLRTSLSLKPRIVLELRQFTFLKEEATLRLRQVPQQRLPLDVREKLGADFNKNVSVASACLEIVDMAAQFLGAQSNLQLDEHVGNMLLCDYLRTALLLEPTDLPLVATRHVRLMHLEDFWRFLQSLCSPHKASIRGKYKDTLPDELESTLRAVVEKIDIPVLVDCLSSLMRDYLTEDFIAANESLKVVLGMSETKDGDLSSLPWFEYFPAELLMAHTEEVSKVLNALEMVD
eukprot:GEMP01000023.1.p1 GENE.GEMP01000023.1~~GEMP01000023.1.p1  ORF type:complete len:4845 (-),score=1374.35 GEMP01000023.1:551-15064(-)